MITFATSFSAKNLPGGQTQVLNVCRIRTIDYHPAESDENSAPESISDTENCLNWNGDLDNPNDSKDDWEADDKSDIEQDNGIEYPESPEKQDLSTPRNVPGLIPPTQRSNERLTKCC